MTDPHDHTVLPYDRPRRRSQGSVLWCRLISLAFMMTGIALVIHEASNRQLLSLRGTCCLAFAVIGMAGYVLGCIMQWDEEQTRHRRASANATDSATCVPHRIRQAISDIRSDNGFVD